MGIGKQPFKYSTYCSICGDFYIHTDKKKVHEHRKHHQIEVPIKDLHLLAITSGKKPVAHMCPMMQVIDPFKRQITYARPSLATHLNKSIKEKIKKHKGGVHA